MQPALTDQAAQRAGRLGSASLPMEGRTGGRGDPMAIPANRQSGAAVRGASSADVVHVGARLTVGSAPQSASGLPRWRWAARARGTYCLWTEGMRGRDVPGTRAGARSCSSAGRKQTLGCQWGLW